jgi:hypothetical protein
MRTYQVGQTVYHGWRYWKTDGLETGEVKGWNTLYLPYKIVKITRSQIVVEHKETRIHLNRAKMQTEGKQYHTRFHEYFYAEEPKPESTDRNWASSKIADQTLFFVGDAFSLLGLSLPCTREDVRRAYKRLAKTTHPDLGGSHHAFIKLKQAHDSALRFAQ